MHTLKAEAEAHYRCAYACLTTERAGALLVHEIMHASQAHLKSACMQGGRGSQSMDWPRGACRLLVHVESLRSTDARHARIRDWHIQAELTRALA